MKDNFEIEKIETINQGFFYNLDKLSPPLSSLYIRGNKPKQSVAIAIVGTRKASAYGKKAAYEFSYSLSKIGFSIVSGLAMGIDTSAHQGALDAGGQTIAVLANGLDKIYPASNEHLAEKIMESGGCLISEYPPKTPSYPNQFLMRNRIISGLSAAVIIIEAPFKSGAMATAKFAADQKKPIFVVPGPINSDNFGGSHKLIREGATLVSSVNDFLSDMNFESAKKDNKLTGLTENENVIFSALKNACGPLSVDKICQITKLNPRNAGATLSVMVMKEIIFQDGNNYQINL